MVHSPDDREPLPLALHHSPLAVSFAVFSDINPSQSPFKKEDANKEGSGGGGGKKDFVQKQTILVVDPTKSEEACIDGTVTFSTNAHHELCAVHKPGGVAISAGEFRIYLYFKRLA